ncbi:MAG: UDP-glucose/GDP-mannose dehydrogenase family protein [Deltaproteobacteria bacterium]|nr:UDP-glucose/GDP-mannose dehydrogenase family protein [Deltaproteobacteria bacterium]MCL5277720.1 UDP-glucose/GDP-mannose dehydrogenase family protein [Deltaproteobacteria bacterium]
MKLAIIGTGYVGLVTGTCFADSGNDVVCMDIDREKIDALRKGAVPLYEPGLKELIHKNHREGRLGFTTDIGKAVRGSKIIFIAVGTPPDRNGATDLRGIKAVARDIGRHMNEYKIVVTKSTVPVGTSDLIRTIVSRETDIRFDIASNPEFLKEGAAIDDFMKPDRVVIGVDSEKTGEVLRSLYEPFTRTGNPIIVTDIRSSEMIKYAANAMLATKISFINEFANLCTVMGADIDDVRKGIGYDNRIGHLFLFPGVGYGGSCFPKDVKSIIHDAGRHGYAMELLSAVDRVNDNQKALMPAVIKRHFNGRLRGRRLAVWGLAFKPKTDDIREAPSIVIINALLKAGAGIIAHDPEAMRNIKAVFGRKIGYADDMYGALKNVDGLVLVTEWNEYRKPDLDRMARLMKGRVVFDGRNIFDRRQLLDVGFQYYGIGRRTG